MNKTLLPVWAFLLSVGSVATAADAPPPAAGLYRTSNADLDAQLAAARARLEEAAREVAELSTRLSKPLVDRFMTGGDGPGRAVIGVQLDPESGEGGARVVEVSPGGPAAEAGLHVQDLIVGIDATDIKGDEPARQVQHLMRDVAPETKVKVRVLRDGKPREFVVTARPGIGFFAMHGPNPPGAHDFPERIRVISRSPCRS